MAGKTQQELDDEEAERRRRAASGSGFSLPDLWGWLPSFGTILTGLVILTGLYFIARQEGVQNWIGETFGADAKKFVKDLVGNADGLLGKLASGVGLGDAVNDYAANMPVDDVQKKMRDEGLPDAAITALAGDAETWKGTVAIIKAGGGSVTEPVSDKNIFAFLTQPGGPERVRALTAGVKLTGPMDDKQKAFAAQLTAALKPILADERLDQLLTTHRATTLPLLLQFSPVKFDLAKLNPVLDKVALGADGKVTAEFRELLSSLTAITGDAAADQAAQLAAIKKFLGNPAVNGAVIKQFAQSIDVSAMPTGAMKTYITMAQNATPASIEAARTLLTGPVPPVTLQELAQLGADPKQGPARLVDRLLNDGNLRQQIADGHALQPIGVLLMEKARTSTDPQEKAALAFLTTRPANQPNRFVNMEALFNLVDAVAQNPHNIAKDGFTNKGTNIVMRGFIGYVTATNEADRAAALKTLSPQAMQFFFSDPKNSAALGAFFKTMNNAALPPQQRALINALRAHWGEVVTDKNGHLDTEKSHGLAEILADPKAVAFLLEQMRHPDASKPKPTEASLRRNLGIADTFGGTLVGNALGVPNTGTIPQNAQEVIALMKASGQLALPTTAEVNAQAIMRSRGGLGILG